jgi:hypothetical protein
MVKGGGYIGVGLGKGERDAVGHKKILAGFGKNLIGTFRVLDAFAGNKTGEGCGRPGALFKAAST